jgi:hypothetical protein
MAARVFLPFYLLSLLALVFLVHGCS